LEFELRMLNHFDTKAHDTQLGRFG
jgi:hypothetical protein